jgi:zinc transporter 2
MLITSFVSLACNIFNLIALGHFPMPCLKKKLKEGEVEEENFMDSIMSIYKPHGGHTCSHHHHGHGGHGHDHHEHLDGDGECSGHDHDHDHDHDHGHGEQGHTHTHGDEQDLLIETVDPTELQLDGPMINASTRVTEVQNSIVVNPDPKKLIKGFGKPAVDQEAEHKHDHGHSHGHDHGHSHGHKEEENINIRAAVVHVIGDMIQSIGVIIAALIIHFFGDSNKEVLIVDPICTYLFSILVIFTTIPVFKDCVRVLMESNPKGNNTD